MQKRDGHESRTIEDFQPDTDINNCGRNDPQQRLLCILKV